MRDFVRSISFFYLVQQQQLHPTKRFREELSLPPMKTIDGTESRYNTPISLLYTNDPDAVSDWIEKNISKRPTVIGWDTESSPDLPWRPAKYAGPATVQVSTVEACMVLEIANEKTGPCYDSLLPLKDMLADPSVLKAGAGLDLDMLDLYRWSNEQNERNTDTITDIFGRLDIGGIGSKSGRSASLKNLVKVILGLDLPKSKKIAMSNWARAPLTEAQLLYAGRDAWVSAAMMEELCLRDPSIFSVSALLDTMGQRGEEQTMAVMDERAVERKELKTRLLKIMQKNGEKIPMKELSEEDFEKAMELREEMKEWSPPQRIVFDVEHLGYTLWSQK